MSLVQECACCERPSPLASGWVEEEESHFCGPCNKAGCPDLKCDEPCSADPDGLNFKTRQREEGKS